MVFKVFFQFILPIYLIFFFGKSYGQIIKLTNENNTNSCDVSHKDNFPRLNISLKFPSTTVKKEGLYEFYNISAVLIESLPRSVDFSCVSEFPVDWNFRQSLSVKWDHWEIEYGRIYVNATLNYFLASLNLLKINPSTLPTLGKEGPFCTTINNSCFQATVNGEYSGTDSDTLVYFNNESNIRLGILFKDRLEDVNCTIKMGFNSETQEFFCETLDLETRPLVYVKSCSNPNRCLSEIYPRNCTNEAPNYEKCKPPFCEKTRLNIDFLPAIAFCRLKSRSAAFTVHYFYSIHHNSNVKRYFDWNETDGSDMIVISQPDEFPIYPFQPLKFTCNASYYYCASGLRFEIYESQNDITHYVNKTFMEAIEYQKTASSFYKLNRTLEVNITLQDPGSYTFICYAPVWNSSRWISSIVKFIINESFPPKILNLEELEKPIHIELQQLNGTKCIANGSPLPKIEWLDEFGFPLPKYFTTNVVNDTENSTSTISFEKISNQINGLRGTLIYCVASNPAGLANITYYIDRVEEFQLGLIISLASCGLLVLTIGIIAVLSRKVFVQKEKLKQLSNEEYEEFFNGHPNYISSSDGENENYIQAQFMPYNKAFDMDREYFKIGDFMDSGTDKIVHFGTVMVNGKVQKVAISQPRRDLKPMLYELKILSSIGTHENIVNLVRACTKNLRKGEVLVATELCENGSLLKYLKNNKELFEQIILGSLPILNEEIDSTNKKYIGVPLHAYVTMGISPMHNVAFTGDYEMPDVVRHSNDLINWSIQIAKGMEFLNNKFIIHGDLAARNVLLTGNRIAKICDFGLSRKIDYVNTYHLLEKCENENQKIPWRSAAPEVLRANKLSPKSDVWSYGVTIWEIFTLGSTPYSESYKVFSTDFIQSLEMGKIQLQQPYLASSEIFILMKDCWELDPLKRPRFEDIATKISSMLQNIR